jgi:PKD repeat protein
VSSSFQKKRAWMFYPVFLCAIFILVSAVAAQTTATIKITGELKERTPVAAFIGAPTSGTALLRVMFTDQTTPTPRSWKWEYRNETVDYWTQFSTAQNPSYLFPAGTYDIRLTATNTAGSDDDTKFDYITVSAPVKKPVAWFFAYPNFGKTPLRVTFKDTSLNNPTSYHWIFGDGTTSSLKNPPIHEYRWPGVYKIQLTVSNSAGSDTTERYVVAQSRWWWFDWDWR